MESTQAATIEYLDPVSPNLDRKLVVPAVGALEGKTIGLLNNGWKSLTFIFGRVEEALRTQHGIKELRVYPIPTAGPPEPGLLDRVQEECDAAIVGMAN
jgi:hypothetical protein